MPESIDAHLYLVDNSITMIPLASGVDDIIPDVQSSMVLLSLITVIVPTYTNSTVSYTATTPTISDVYFQTTTYSFSMTENNFMQTTLDLPCSSSGSTSISFSFGNYNGGSVPSWIQIDSNTGVLNITTPDISQDIEFNFYIYSGMSVSSNLVQIPKLIKFKVLNCNAQN